MAPDLTHRNPNPPLEGEGTRPSSAGMVASRIRLESHTRLSVAISDPISALWHLPRQSPMAARDHARPALQAPGEFNHHAIRVLVPIVKRCRTNPEAITLGALCAAQLIIDFDVACLVMLICVFSQLFVYSHLVQPLDFTDQINYPLSSYFPQLPEELGIMNIECYAPEKLPNF